MDDGAKKLAKLLAAAKRILVFTGAGISTGSGIPDYRGPNGIWKVREPVFYQDFLLSEESRLEYWDYKLESHKMFKKAKPNAAHRAVVELERLGVIEAVVTQNIDALHQAAGSDPAKVIELHGTWRTVECLSCGRVLEPEPVFEEFERTRKLPQCACGGILKPGTVMFGQPMPQDQVVRAFDAASRADLVVAVGSTLQVEPAASVPATARRRGLPYVIINRGPTAHDDIATLRLEGDAGELLAQALALLKAKAAS